jgi:hypothetical protein
MRCRPTNEVGSVMVIWKQRSALSVEKTWIRTVLEEQIDGLHQAVPRSPLQQRRDQISPDRVDVRTLLDEICARLESVIDRSPVQRCDAIVVPIRRACAGQLDDKAGIALSCPSARQRRCRATFDSSIHCGSISHLLVVEH